MPPELPDTRRLIEAALAEDIGGGDVTSRAVVPKDMHFEGVIRARHAMVVAGLPFAARVFATVSPAIDWQPCVADGDKVGTETVLARVSGPAQALLAGERTALNLLQHLTGIASLTRLYVEAIRGTGATLLDTRKTIPGLRDLAKYATRMGGAANHRMRLDDGVLIKDNHIAVSGGIKAAVSRCREAGIGPIEVECDTIEQVEEAVGAGADRILLDNMTPDGLRIAVELIKGRAETEASGGVSLDNIRDIAMTGVDFISVGRITQSAPAADIGLDWLPLVKEQAQNA